MAELESGRRGPGASVLLVLLGLLSACAEPAVEPQPPTRIHTRFVAPEARGRTEPGWTETEAKARFPTRPGTASALPVATLSNDTRPVLAAHPRDVIAYLHDLEADGRGTWRAELALPRGFSAGEGVLVELAVRAGAGAWERPPVQRCAARPSGERVVCELTGEAAPAAKLQLTAWALRPTDRLLHETLPIEVPAEARLRVDLGIDAAAPDAGAVEFRIEACRSGDDCAPLLRETVEAGPAVGRWIERSLAIDGIAGESRFIRFEARSTSPGGAAPVFGDPLLEVLASESPARPNVVLLSIDTLRADHLELYGHPRETAPFLAARARSQGTFFRRVTSEAATTDPSHMTLFTGLSALVHGVQRDTTSLGIPVRTLAEILRENGYLTAAFTENGPLAHQRGFRIGFDRYIENKSSSLLSPTGQVDRTFAQAREWMEQRSAAPFFAFLHTFQVHEPYAPPPDYAALFEGDELSRDLHPLANAYDAEIRLVDDELRKLVGWMDDAGLSEDTVWVVLSDHGEEFGEHGSVGHGTLPYQTVLHVPLVMWGPGVPEGAVVDRAAHHLDLLPTLLELLGLPAEPDLPGRSLLPLQPAGESDGEERGLLSASWILPPELEPPAFALKGGPRKLVRYRDRQGGVHRLWFDLALDPAEQESAPPPADEARALERRLDRLLADADRRRGLLADDAEDDSGPWLDPESEEKLRALGYID